MKKYKVDVIIPIYNSLDWLKLCVESIFKNTNYDVLGTVYLLDDCSSEETVNYLKEVERKYGNLVKYIRNNKNLGFVKTCNKGLKLSTSSYVLLLNTDCLVSTNAIEKMANAMNKNNKIGLLCPISSVAANLSYPIPLGLNFMQVNEVFEKQFSGKTFDACTVVGNCLMISRECINKVGYLDEIFGKGYTEETDYQFKAHEKGFLAKVLIDTYVYHQCRVSFGESEEQLAIREEHLKIFFERWHDEYDKKYAKYVKNDPIVYINNNVSYDDIVAGKQIKIKSLKQLEEFAPIINTLMLDKINIKVICKEKILNKYNGIILFNPARRRS